MKKETLGRKTETLDTKKIRKNLFRCVDNLMLIISICFGILYHLLYYLYLKLYSNIHKIVISLVTCLIIKITHFYKYGKGRVVQRNKKLACDSVTHISAPPIIHMNK